MKAFDKRRDVVAGVPVNQLSLLTIRGPVDSFEDNKGGVCQIHDTIFVNRKTRLSRLYRYTRRHRGGQNVWEAPSVSGGNRMGADQRQCHLRR